MDPILNHLDRLDQDGQPLTHDDALTALATHAGDAPCSRYGRSFREWGPVAAAVAVILSHEAPEGAYTEHVEHAASLTVNDHDDVAYLLVNYGPEHDLDPADYLAPEVIAAASSYLDAGEREA